MYNLGNIIFQEVNNFFQDNKVTHCDLQIYFSLKIYLQITLCYFIIMKIFHFLKNNISQIILLLIFIYIIIKKIY